jgi:hypothetical protein
MAYKKRDILGTLSKRGDLDLYHVEPVIEVHAETFLLDEFLEISVRGRDDAYIHLHGPDPAQGNELPFLNGPKKLDLKDWGDIADLV